MNHDIPEPKNFTDQRLSIPVLNLTHSQGETVFAVQKKSKPTNPHLIYFY